MGSVSPNELALWSSFIHNICGIQLDSSKGYLIETRLGPLLRDTGSSNFSDLYNKAKVDPTKGIRKKIIDAITTQETSFFRDTSPFELVKHKVLPDLIDKRSKILGIDVQSLFASGAQPARRGRKSTASLLPSRKFCSILIVTMFVYWVRTFLTKPSATPVTATTANWKWIVAWAWIKWPSISPARDRRGKSATKFEPWLLSRL